MKKLTHIQKLDRVLKFFEANTIPEDSLHFAVILNLLNTELSLEDFSIDEKELKTIINKLVKDGNLMPQFVHTDAGTDTYMYRITFEGQTMDEEGGYGQRLIRQNAENTRLETLERFQRVNANRMTCLTIVIAVGTLVAACYYGVELWKYFHCE